ncbi:hypothetical protein GCM10027589_27820 [Actinocorallia lasiicapitis]
MRSVGGKSLGERVLGWTAALPPEDAPIVTLAALARDLDPAPLAEAAGVSEDRVVAVLESGVAARVLPDLSLLPEQVRALVLARVHPSQRTRLAAHLADVLARRADIPSGRIAALYLSAGDPRAVAWCRRAATDALSPDESAAWIRALTDIPVDH